MPQWLAPGVQNGAKAALGSSVLGISGDGAQRSGHSLAQKSIDDLLVLEGQCGDGLRQGEDHVAVEHGQSRLLASLAPAGLGQRWTRGAMAGAAGVVSRALVAARGIVARLEMAAQRGGAAPQDGPPHGLLEPGAGSLVGVEKRGTVEAHTIRDFSRRS